jgi:hypothetical protein
VAAWCSGAGEDDARDDQVRLPPHRRLWLRDDGDAPADGRPERINASGLEGGLNRPAKQTRPISANFCPDPGTSGLFRGTSRKIHLGVFSWSFRESDALSLCYG